MSVFGPGTKSGHDDVDPDAVDPHLTRQGLRGDRQRRLGRGVRALPGVDRAHRQRRHDDDGAATGVPEVWNRGPAELERTEHVHQPRLLPVGEFGVHDRVVRRALGRAAHDDIEPAELLDRTLHQSTALGDVAGVGRHRQCTGIELLELGDDLGEVVGSSCRDDDIALVTRHASAVDRPIPGPTPVTTATRPGPAHRRTAPKSSAIRASSRASSLSSSACHPASASAAASIDAARNRR